MVPFNNFINVKYNSVKIASDEATSRMSNVSLGKCIKKFDVLFIEEEHATFSQAVYQPTSLYDFNFKFGYFCICNFFICGCFELQNAKFEEFVLVQLPTSLVLRFCPRVSKNKHINVTKCFVD
jgi:hypothetical protein